MLPRGSLGGRATRPSASGSLPWLSRAAGFDALGLLRAWRARRLQLVAAGGAISSLARRRRKRAPSRQLPEGSRWRNPTMPLFASEPSMTMRFQRAGSASAVE